MKKLMRFLFAGSFAAAMVLGCALSVRAQDQVGGDQADPANAGDPGPKKWDHFDGFKDKLGLTDEQETKLKELFKSQGEEGKPLRDRLQLDKDTLKLQVDTNASSSEISATLEKLSGDKKALESSREKAQQKIREILSPKQQAQMILMRENHHPMGFGAFGRQGKGGWGKPGMNHPWKGHKKDSKKPKDSDATNSAPASQN